MEKIKKMHALVKELSEAAKAYEQHNREIMTNLEYDKKYDELEKLEQELNIVLAGSVTQKVGYEVISNLQKINHKKPMLSLNKTKEIEELEQFLGDKEGVLSWKLDGLTVVCTYNNGQLMQAVTRGNGTVGEDVTNNAKTFKNLPLKIDYQGNLTIRGEAIITYSDFNIINENLSDEEKYKNPRNLCSGSVRQLNSEETAKRNVQFFAFSIVEIENQDFELKSQTLTWLQEQGFDIAGYFLVNKEKIASQIHSLETEIINNDFGSDGLVLTYDNIEYSKSLGTTSKFPKDSIAFKWSDELKETKIIEIEWNTSRTGLINPVANFEVVELEGTEVRRASVHNISILEQLKLGIGDTVIVYKANMIIPQIAENLTKSGPVEVPKNCSVCGCETIIKQEKSAKMLYCPNGNCEAQMLKSISHFASRNAMNIESLSEATIEKLMKNNILINILSIYKLKQHEEELKTLEGFKEQSYNRLIKAVDNSRTTTLAQVLHGLGIMQVGLATAKLICTKFDDDINKILVATEEDFLEIDGIGKITAEALVHYFSLDENKTMINDLMLELTLIKQEKLPQQLDSQIFGKTFVITGDLMHFENRKALQLEIEKHGGKVTGSVSKKTNYLINNDNLSTSSKNKKAKDLEIPILTEDMVLDLLK
ncbi:MAG: DNA ligase (NAD(+)) LigA [Epulopiscium sp. Nele67-Bin005]|nr:MAG: DNA ligase (NAD(+)) LigA [Epulopiscium sp. Nele67-Bin005]